MSYGTFEASATDGFQEDQRQAEAVLALDHAIHSAKEQFGDYVALAANRREFKDRIALVKPDLMKVIAEHVMPLPRIVRKVEAELMPDFAARTAENTTISQGGFTGTVTESKVAPGNFSWEVVEDATGETYDHGSSDASVSAYADMKATINHATGQISAAIDDAPELVPEGDFEGYLDSVDQDAPAKVERHNFAAYDEDEQDPYGDDAARQDRQDFYKGEGDYAKDASRKTAKPGRGSYYDDPFSYDNGVREDDRDDGKNKDGLTEEQVKSSTKKTAAWNLICPGCKQMIATEEQTEDEDFLEDLVAVAPNGAEGIECPSCGTISDIDGETGSALLYGGKAKTANLSPIQKAFLTYCGGIPTDSALEDFIEDHMGEYTAAEFATLDDLEDDGSGDWSYFANKSSKRKTANDDTEEIVDEFTEFIGESGYFTYTIEDVYKALADWVDEEADNEKGDIVRREIEADPNSFLMYRGGSKSAGKKLADWRQDTTFQQHLLDTVGTAHVNDQELIDALQDYAGIGVMDSVGEPVPTFAKKKTAAPAKVSDPSEWSAYGVEDLVNRQNEVMYPALDRAVSQGNDELADVLQNHIDTSTEYLRSQRPSAQAKKKTADWRSPDDYIEEFTNWAGDCGIKMHTKDDIYAALKEWYEGEGNHDKAAWDSLKGSAMMNPEYFISYQSEGSKKTADMADAAIIEYGYWADANGVEDDFGTPESVHQWAIANDYDESVEEMVNGTMSIGMGYSASKKTAAIEDDFLSWLGNTNYDDMAEAVQAFEDQRGGQYTEQQIGDLYDMYADGDEDEDY
ncbi:hypothetical protein KHQ84_gp012 [Rhodococcus phage Finch]|uniref:Uncharacterized protein n=1 Tax=Rhodococcus phage Finch TaxID=2094144 RepID=A0A2P1JXA2_9CAUD|nr:hypothetical protein KHQ84_gp012 [Rhodococcus phage Finch]AVO24961.1 hypothetical protein SEA_FINCH_12 [Rhodococcus phage Finch]